VWGVLVILAIAFTIWIAKVGPFAEVMEGFHIVTRVELVARLICTLITLPVFFIFVGLAFCSSRPFGYSAIAVSVVFLLAGAVNLASCILRGGGANPIYLDLMGGWYLNIADLVAYGALLLICVLCVMIYLCRPKPR